MKLVNTVRKKIWLCVNMALLGFLIATGFALYSNQQLQVHLTHIRDLDFHLAMRSSELVKQFDAQKLFYEESFLFGLLESAQKGNALSDEIAHTLSAIAHLSRDSEHLNQSRVAELEELVDHYREFSHKAAVVYPLLAQGEDPSGYLATLQELSSSQNGLSASLNRLADFYRNAFNSHVSSQIELADRNNQVLGGLLLALLGFITLVVNRAANHMLISPLAQIKEAVRTFGKGRRDFPHLEKMDMNDDIGELGQAFLKMSQELEATTVSKAFVDSILRNMNDNLIVTSTDFTIRSVNRATLELLGYREVELSGQSIDLILKDFVIREADQAVIDDLNLLPYLCHNAEKTLVTADGCEIPVLLSISWIKEGANSAQGLVFVAKDITERKQAELQLKQLAQFDFLTGLPNRMVFADRLRRSIHRAQRENRQVGLMFIDLDRFKIINDTLGHAAGDTLLKTLATRLDRCVRENDTIARLGGDEFAVILENISHHEDAAISAARLLQAALEPVIHGENKMLTSASIGIALYPSDADSTDALLRNADMAMYQAKEAGGNAYRFFSEPIKTSNDYCPVSLVTERR